MERTATAPDGAHDEASMDFFDDPCRVADLRRFLRGRWRLARAIDDRRAWQVGVLRGEARFEADGAGLVCCESGRLRVGAYAGPAFRRSLYRFPAPGRADVLFADGRPFHELDLSAGACTAVHRCGVDTYRGAFKVVDANTLLVRWTVTGPCKDAVLTSRYRRRGARIG